MMKDQGFRNGARRFVWADSVGPKRREGAHPTVRSDRCRRWLVEIDEALDACQILIARPGSARAVLGMPKLKIGEVVFGHRQFQAPLTKWGWQACLVPSCRVFVLPRNQLDRAVIEEADLRGAGHTFKKSVVSSPGIEPGTHALKVRCSTN